MLPSDILLSVRALLTDAEAARFDRLDDAGKALLVEALGELGTHGRSKIVDDLWYEDYLRIPVPVRQFVEDDYYLGLPIGEDRGKIFPTWIAALEEIYSKGAFEVIFSGAIGSGKCIHKDAIMFAAPSPGFAGGLVTAKEVHDNVRITHIQAESGVRRIVSRHDEGMTDGLTIATKHGHRITVRPNHRLRALSDLDAAWVEARDLCIGDTLLRSSMRAESFGNAELGAEYAELIGWAVAEGSFQNETHYTVLSVHVDERDYVCKLAEATRRFSRITYVDEANSSTIRLYDDGSFRKLFDRYDDSDRVAVVNSRNIRVPSIILRSSSLSMCAFMRGLFSGDGCAHGGMVDLVVMSRGLVEDVATLLSALGIEASIGSSTASYTSDRTHVAMRGSFAVGCDNGKRRVVTGTKWRCRLVGLRARVDFSNRIGFAQEYKRTELANGLVDNRNADHSYSFGLTETAARSLRDMQPSGYDVCLPKNKSPKSKISRLVRGQRCTVSLLDEIVCVGGSLPPILDRFRTGALQFDEITSIEPVRVYCYDFTVEGDPSYVADGFINHNTTVAAIALAYKIYLLSCLKDPQRFYGLLPQHPIRFGLYNVFKYKAQSTSFPYLRALVEHSPYFADNFQYNKDRANVLEFPHNISIIVGASELHALGENLFGVMIDETDFMRAGADSSDVGQAYKLYTSTIRRMESRFQRVGGDVPGLLILISSKTSELSFLSNRIEANKDNPKAVIVDKSQWEVRPWLYSGETFPVYVGSGISDPAVLTEFEAEGHPESTRILRVPVEHRQAFVEDTAGALRDIAGVATTSSMLFLPDKKAILACVDESRKHPFAKQQFSITLDDPANIDSYLIHKDILDVRESKYRPRVRSGAPRFLHIDLGITNDACGIAMGHVSDFRQIERPIEDPERPGQTVTVSVPVIYMDFVLRIVPKKGTRIDIQKIREFVVLLREYGFRIESVTMDGYQSEEPIQLLLKQGFAASVLSIDKSPTSDKGHPYTFLHRAIVENRISFYDYPQLLSELFNLQRIERTTGTDPKTRWKIDHPSVMTAVDGSRVPGAKDLADATAGVAYAAMTIGEQLAAQGLPQAGASKEGRTNTPARGRRASMPYQTHETWIAGDYDDIDRIQGVQ